MNQPHPPRTIDQPAAEELLAEIAGLRQQLADTRQRMEELEETVSAIQGGSVDAVVVSREGSTQVWTLEAAERLHLDLSKQTANIGTWDLDINTQQVTWSDSLLHIFGASSHGPPTFEDLLGLIYVDDRDRVAERIRQTIQHADEFYEEFRVVRCNSDLRWVAARGRVVRSFRRKPERLVGIALDITERKLAEEELRQADRRKDEFLATLAHELRNPLAAISNAIALTQNTNPTPEEKVWIEEMMQRQTEQLGRLIEDLLDVARISRSKIELRKDVLPLNDLAQRAAETLRPQFEGAQHELFVQLSRDEVYVDADPNRMEQVLVNLLTNAIKYTTERGKIWLKIERQGSEAVICVKDTGIGIAHDMLSRVFDLFAQAEQGLDRSRGGLGIGLTLVRRIVELHGGCVSVASEGIGCGSEFTVRIPAVARDQLPAVPAHPTAAAGRGERVLVVDDNRDAALGLSLLLKASGHETAVAYDGLQAIALAAEFNPSAALLDIGLPGMNGLELAAALRKAQPQLYLVAVSGYGQPEDRERSKSAGFDEHFVKGMSFDDLLQVLQSRRG